MLRIKYRIKKHFLKAYLENAPFILLYIYNNYIFSIRVVVNFEKKIYIIKFTTSSRNQ